MTGTLEDLRFTASPREHYNSVAAEGQCPGRVVEAFQELYTVSTGSTGRLRTLSGRLRSRLAIARRIPRRATGSSWPH